MSFFAETAAPASTTRVQDFASVELGMRFTTSINGSMSGLRYFRAAGDTGVHVGRLWSSTGALLGRLSFPAKSTVGWQYAAFRTAVSVEAGNVLVASYRTTRGYAAESNYFTTQSLTRGPLSTTTNGGVFTYGLARYPTENYTSTNYWIDPVLMPGVVSPPPPPPPTDAGVAPNTIPLPGQVGFRGNRSGLRVVNSAASAPAGTTWTGSFLRIDGSGVVLDGVYVKGSIEYYGTGTLTIRNSVIEAGGGSWSVIYGQSPSGTMNISDSTIVWPSTVATPGSTWGNGAVHGDTKMILVRNDISGTPDGVQQGTGSSRFEQNYIHGLRMERAYPNHTHNDGIQLYGGPGVQVLYNRIELNGYDGTHQNAALFLSDDGNGFTGPQVIGNYLSGGGFQLRLEDGVSGAVVTGTRFGPLAGGFGEFNVTAGATVARWEDNRSASGALLQL